MIKIILDTDLGSDCDDAGALSVLHNLANNNEADVLAVTYCGSAISSAVSIQLINEWYNRGNIPVGIYTKKSFLDNDRCKFYTPVLMNQYIEKYEMKQFEDSVRALRKALVENEDVTLIAIGMQNNIAELLKSGADDISELSGAELVKKSIKNMYAMGGCFNNPEYKEYNIATDTESAIYVSENFPAPVYYCGFELGEYIKTGVNLWKCPKNHPTRQAYSIYCKTKEFTHFSWDLITVYCAVHTDTDLYKKSRGCSITFDEEGRTILSESGKDYYMIENASPAEITRAIDKLLI